MYLAENLNNSKIPKDMADVPNPFAMRWMSKNLSLLKMLININPMTPEKNPKFNNPCGIQKLSISIKAIQIKSDKNNQL